MWGSPNNYLQTALIIALGAAASYQDIRTKRIRNSLLAAAVFAFAALYAAGLIAPAPWKMADVLTNAAFGCLASVILWRSGVWPAGDAKLFMVLALIVPLDYYRNHFLPYFPSFALIVNSFFIAFALLTLMALADMLGFAGRVVSGEAHLERSLKSAAALIRKELPLFVKSTLGLIGIFIPARIAGDYLLGFTGSFFHGVLVVNFMIAFLLYRQIMTFMSKHVALWQCALVAAAGIALKYVLTGYDAAALWAYVLTVLKITLMFMVGISAIMKIFSTYIKMTQTTHLPACELERGMMLDKEFWGEYIKANKESCEARTLRPEGLEECQVEALRRTMCEGDTAPVVKTYPFAPIIFAGMLVTMAIRGSLLHLLILWFKR